MTSLRFFIVVFLCALSLPVFANKNLESVRYGTNATGSTIERREPMFFEIVWSNKLWAPFRWLSLVIDINHYVPRGRMKWKKITVSPHIRQDSEFIQILVHELGHFVDTYLLRRTFFADDPSKDFYAISWKNPKLKHTGQSYQSFVSGYAATNQWEDFAESFVWYVFHNQSFAERALKNSELKKKYLFFSQSVFPWKIFQGTDFSIGKKPAFVWDTSKTRIFLKKYLSFLKK